MNLDYNTTGVISRGDNLLPIDYVQIKTFDIINLFTLFAKNFI